MLVMGVPVDAEADSVPMDDEPPPPVTGQPVDTRASWPVAPELDVFVENSDSTKRARVTLPSGFTVGGSGWVWAIWGRGCKNG